MKVELTVATACATAVFVRGGTAVRPTAAAAARPGPPRIVKNGICRRNTHALPRETPVQRLDSPTLRGNRGGLTAVVRPIAHPPCKSTGKGNPKPETHSARAPVCEGACFTSRTSVRNFCFQIFSMSMCHDDNATFPTAGIRPFRLVFRVARAPLFPHAAKGEAGSKDMRDMDDAPDGAPDVDMMDDMVRPNDMSTCATNNPRLNVPDQCYHRLLVKSSSSRAAPGG